jgi:hypothetical protein
MQMAEYINSSSVIFKCAMFMYGDLIRRISSGHPPKKHSNRAIIHLSDMTPEAVQFFSFRIWKIHFGAVFPGQAALAAPHLPLRVGGGAPQLSPTVK